jgi:hypothetical protein
MSRSTIRDLSSPSQDRTEEKAGIIEAIDPSAPGATKVQVVTGTSLSELNALWRASPGDTAFIENGRAH